MAEGRPNSLLSSIPSDENRSFLPYTIVKVVAAYVSPHFVHL